MGLEIWALPWPRTAAQPGPILRFDAECDFTIHKPTPPFFSWQKTLVVWLLKRSLPGWWGVKKDNHLGEEEAVQRQR
jgi:hypothetical protein